MKVPWEATQCIICLGGANFTEEHIIPAALGGRLTCNFLCAGCNSRLGHKIEGDAKADPTIQLLARSLADNVPHLAARLFKGQTFLSSGPGGSSRGRIKDGEFVVQAAKISENSLILPTPIAAHSIRRMFERDGRHAAEISEVLSLFEQAPENTRIALSEKIEIVKWGIENIKPALDGPLLNLAAPLKTAYEFLALHLSTAIFQDAPALVAARRALQGDPIDQTHIIVERLHAPEAKAFHGLLFEGNSPYAIVQVRLLGQLAFRVHFKTLAVDGPRFVYTHDLITNEEYVAQASAPTDTG